MNRKAISYGFLRASLTMTAVLLLLFLSAPPLRAQVDTGTILGTVTDASGAARAPPSPPRQDRTEVTSSRRSELGATS